MSSPGKTAKSPTGKKDAQEAPQPKPQQAIDPKAAETKAAEVVITLPEKEALMMGVSLADESKIYYKNVEVIQPKIPQEQADFLAKVKDVKVAGVTVEELDKGQIVDGDGFEELAPKARPTTDLIRLKLMNPNAPSQVLSPTAMISRVKAAIKGANQDLKRSAKNMSLAVQFLTAPPKERELFYTVVFGDLIPQIDKLGERPDPTDYPNEADKWSSARLEIIKQLTWKRYTLKTLSAFVGLIHGDKPRFMVDCLYILAVKKFAKKPALPNLNAIQTSQVQSSSASPPPDVSGSSGPAFFEVID